MRRGGGRSCRGGWAGGCQVEEAILCSKCQYQSWIFVLSTVVISGNGLYGPIAASGSLNRFTAATQLGKLKYECQIDSSNSGVIEQPPLHTS